MKYNKRRILIYSLTTAAIMVLIFSFSSQNADQSKNLSEGFSATPLGQFIIGIISNFSIYGTPLTIRKCAHIFVYFCLGISSTLLFREIFITKTALPYLCGELLSALYACTDEWHQTFSPGRSGELRDVLIDATGAFGGVLLTALICAVIYKKFKRRD